LKPKKTFKISVQEKELLQRLKDSKSKDGAFRELVNQSKKNLYFQIRRLVLSHEDTNDVLQNVYIKIYRSIEKFKEKSKLSTWIYRIAYNESINFLKSKEKKYFFSSEIMYNTMINNLRQDPYFDGDELDIKLQEIIAKLPPKQKLVFQMKYYQNKKFKDISQILGTSIGALKTSYHLAKNKIKKEISENQTF
tara:strand:- start:1523 stop:2101 length:579 start_codon:yes stop_codon:yes gene_type:complete